jgi:predicted TIM-barrel fold metal-dependent hydrolase
MLTWGAVYNYPLPIANSCGLEKLKMMYTLCMQMTVDFHTHVVASYVLSRVFDRVKEYQAGQAGLDRLKQIRQQARKWAKPFVGSIHQASTLIRYLPDAPRYPIERFFRFLPWPGLLIESSAQDLLEAMNQADVHLALVTAHPFYLTNKEVMGLAQANNRFIPVVTFGEESSNPGQALRKFAKQGAKAIKIYPSTDASVLKSKNYLQLLTTAADLGIPIMIGSELPHHLRRKTLGRAEFFEPWFKNYSNLNFILVHLNLSSPSTALTLCESYPNLYVETSWQPPEVIAEAVRRAGAERVLFGSDWPWFGDNLEVGKNRVQECEVMGLLTQTQVSLILGGNAVKLLGLA